MNSISIRITQKQGKKHPSPLLFSGPSEQAVQIVGIFLPNLLIILEKMTKYFSKNN